MGDIHQIGQAATGATCLPVTRSARAMQDEVEPVLRRDREDRDRRLGVASRTRPAFDRANGSASLGRCTARSCATDGRWVKCNARLRAHGSQRPGVTRSRTLLDEHTKDGPTFGSPAWSRNSRAITRSSTTCRGRHLRSWGRCCRIDEIVVPQPVTDTRTSLVIRVLRRGRNVSALGTLTNSTATGCAAPQLFRAYSPDPREGSSTRPHPGNVC